MVRDRCIDGQVECALRRHLDSLIPDTPMSDIVDFCRVWESHRDVEIETQISVDRRPARAVCQVPTTSPKMENLEDIIMKLLLTPAIRPPQTVLIPSGPGCPHSATDGSDMPTNAGGTGAIGGD